LKGAPVITGLETETHLELLLETLRPACGHKRRRRSGVSVIADSQLHSVEKPSGVCDHSGPDGAVQPDLDHLGWPINPTPPGHEEEQ